MAMMAYGVFLNSFRLRSFRTKGLFLESFNHFVYGVEELGSFYVPEAHLLASSTP